MKQKMTVSRFIFLLFAVILLIGISFVCVIPIWHVIMISVSNPTAVTAHRGLVFWRLKEFDVQAYRIIFQYESLWSGYLNTIIYIIMSCLFTGFLTVVAGYVFSRKRFRMRNTYMMIISFTMLFNGGMIPTYMVIKNLGMIDSIWAMTVPGSLSVFNIILMRTAMQGVPDALEEAARLDGASEFVTMFKIIFPLCKATFAVIILFTIVGKWNDFMSALLYLPTRTDLYPLQMEIRKILLQNTKEITSGTDAISMNLYSRNIQYAVIVVTTLPVLVAYPFVQKYFVTGMTVGAVKA